LASQAVPENDADGNRAEDADENAPPDRDKDAGLITMPFILELVTDYPARKQPCDQASDRQQDIWSRVVEPLECIAVAPLQSRHGTHAKGRQDTQKEQRDAGCDTGCSPA